MRSKTTKWRKYVIAALVLVFVTSIPLAAHASFSASTQASQKVTTGAMPPPASAAVSMNCDDRVFLFFVKPRITVTSYAPVARANYYDIKIYDPSGNLQYTGNLGTEAGKSYTADQYKFVGTWRYEIRAHYKVPGSTNIWSSVPFPGTLNCP